MSASPALTPVSFSSGDDRIRAEIAAPAAGGRRALVLVPDVRGLSDLYRRIGARFAEQDLRVLVLDIYSREGTPDLPDMEAVNRCIAALDDRRVLGDLRAAVAHLAARDDVDSDRIGIAGFCLGGQYAAMAACQLPGLSACVSFYGMLRYHEYPPHKPASVLDMATELTCPMLGLYGREDPLIPMADVEELARTLAGAGKDFSHRIFDGAGHAFLNDERPDAYRPEAAAAAWSLAAEFLEETL